MMYELLHKQMFGLQNRWQFLSNPVIVALQLIFITDFIRFQQHVLLDLLFEVHHYLLTI